ncbi:hypothetical protein O181_015821 [Austropuccinia psidii MF-1]|uniref:Integrase zinc-binding domain-containing protein n=1 Tax=Austropuccinia psidii MF-1 TaxID=1389203 RepID=A0A9Q3C4G6_9BASI|nr:hypothetical protein [Austropuccinia psidii MF-1]
MSSIFPLQMKRRSQARTQAVLTPTPRAPLNGTPAVPQLRAHLNRGPNVQGAEPSRKEGRVPRISSSFSGVVGRFPGLSRTTLKGPSSGGPTPAQSNQSVSHQSEPSLLAIMQQITQIMANLQAASSSEASRPPAFKTPSMEAPECFDSTQPFKVRSFIQSCQLIFHNDLANVSQDRKKFLYVTSFLIGRAAKWIEPYISNLTNQDTNYLLNSWNLFESQLFTLFGDQNEVSKPEAELDSLRMKEVIDTSKGEDLILGFDFINRLNTSIDCRQGLLTFNADNKDYYYPSKSFCNDFLYTKSCAALVGDSRTPSSPSSVHIPSLNSHQSLLSFRAEVFKEIQDHDSLEELWDEEKDPEEIETMMKVFPSVYHKYLDVFSKVKEDKLAPHCTCDHHIELEGSLPSAGVIYSLSNQESDTLRAYISENVEKGFMQPSSSSTGAAVLFVKKKNGGLHLCVYYRKLNSVTRKNKYPVPPMNHLLILFNGSSIFSNIYCCGAYNRLRIKKGDEHLRCFGTKYGIYEYLVMPFGLANAPASFQNLVNDTFYDILDIYVVVYLDYIMVFYKSEEEHVTHLSTVLARLRANNLFDMASKPQDRPSKSLANSQLATPKKPQGTSIIPWLCNPYHHLIKNYSKKISSITSFLKKDSHFPLHEEALRQFQQLKEAFTIAPLLSHFYPSLTTIVETDASDYALVAVLSQISDSGKHPIAFYSLLERFSTFSSSFEVPTNHSSLQSFISSKILSCHQAHWAEFHFSITYRPGHLATLPDALSQWDTIYPERVEDFISKNPMNYQKIIKKDEIQASQFLAVKVESFSSLIDSIQKELWKDSQYRSILEDLGKGKSVQDYSLDSSPQLLLFKDRVVVPNDPTIQPNILQKRHESPLARYPGQEKTLKLVKWDLHWPGMTQFIKDYVSYCQQCSRNKNIHHKKFGLLKPLPIPNGLGICLSMDFITQ